MLARTLKAEFSDKNCMEKVVDSYQQGRIQDFYDGVSISKKLQEYIGLISFDHLLTI